MDSNMEIRKIPPGKISALIDILEVNDDWKKVMALVPMDLTNDLFIPKYTSEHMKLIKSHSDKIGKRCAEIFLDEWGTSGQTRPTLRTLQKLALKADIYRAACEIAKILEEPPPDRPSKGPAAAIDTDINKLLDYEDIEKQLDNIKTLDSLCETTTNDSYNNNLDKDKCYDNVKIQNFIEKYVRIPENCTTVQMKSISDMIHFQTQSENVIGASNVHTNVDSNMIQFSNSFSNCIPALSQLLTSGENKEANLELPAVSKLDTNDTSSTFDPTTSNESQSTSYKNSDFLIIKSISAGDGSYQNAHSSPIFQPSSTPQTISDLNSEAIPQISILLDGKSNTISDNKCDEEILSDSKLISFSYEELATMTNNFSNSSDIAKGTPGKIGDGGFGEVFVGFSKSLGPIAIKKAFEQPTGFSKQRMMTQFNAEVKTLSLFRHENILPILGYCVDGPSPCIISKYIGGGSLRQKLDEKVLNKEQRVNIIFGTVQGLKYLHCGTSRRMIHRDVKSSNILLTTDFTVKLCDFGLARQYLDTTSTTAPIGTSAYMPLEAFHGDVSLKMDVYSFGIVLLEVLTGLKPIFKVNDIEETNIRTFIQENCGDSITPYLDPVIKVWQEANQIFEISQNCLKEKKYRYTITEVDEKLHGIYSS